MTVVQEFIEVQLPRELVEKVGLMMDFPDDDGDAWSIYTACVDALLDREKESGHQR
jgi:hypothetical protein